MKKGLFLTRLRILGIAFLFTLALALSYWGKQVMFYINYLPNIASERTKILIVWNHWFGEKETIARLMIAAKRLNLDLRVVENNEEFVRTVKIATPEHKAARIFKPDLYLALEPFQRRIARIPSYVALTLGTERYLQTNDQSKPEFIEPSVADYDGILYSFDYTDALKSAYEGHGKNFVGMQWYPTVYATDFKPATPKKLLYSGGILWDKTRGSKKYLALFSMLDKAGYLEVCGKEDKWHQLHNSYIGFIPIDGHSLIERIHQSGVSLVLHDRGHIKSGAPTARIFEAAAANAVIISDRHPFVEQHFGSNILYVDIDQSAPEMFRQIDAHLQWIKQHPLEAQQMADNCHDIFNNKFTLENQLERLLALNESKHNPAAYFKRFKDINELALHKLPTKLQLLIKNEEISYRNWTLLVVKDQRLTFYTDKPPMHGLRKAVVLMQTIDKLKEQSLNIPDGHYVFSLHDDVRQSYSWPVLGFAAIQELVQANKVVLIPDNEALNGYSELFHKIDNAKSNYLWANKINKIFWRGAATGLYLNEGDTESYPRLAFMKFAKDKDFLDAKFSGYPVEYSEQHRNYLAKNFPLGKYINPVDSLKYKYLFDIDGHSCSYERMAWILRSNSLLLKHASDKIQWYYNKLNPNVHYLPIAADFSNMQQQLQWAEQHPEEVVKIISNAQQLAERVFNPAQLQQALYQGLLQYSNITQQATTL